MLLPVWRLIFLLLFYDFMITQALGEQHFIWRRLLDASCRTDAQCGSNQFCLRPAPTYAAGICTNCWRCCVLPKAYGTCPQWCNCNEGQTCESQDDCGSGLFCSTKGMDTSSCLPCKNCTDNSHALRGSCAEACPSGDMSGLEELPNLDEDHYVFLAFLAHDISQQGAAIPPALLKEELVAWIAAQGIVGTQAAMALSRMLNGSNESVATSAWMALVSKTTSVSLLCSLYDPNQPPETQPVESSEGCPCNATRDARTFRCPAGQRCSRKSFRQLETDVPRDGAMAVLQAVCIACDEGQYCPEGTYLQDESDLSNLRCPSGFYCPTSKVKRQCPAGFFCIEGSMEPITCDMEFLLTSEPNRRLPMEPETVISRVRDKRDPTHGNYCPQESTRPNLVCSAGYFCPNVSAKMICPKGYSCKAQSTAPWKCPMLTHCPEGTKVPALSYMAFVIAGVTICGMPLLYLALAHLDNSVIAEMDESEEKRRQQRAAAASRVTFRLLKSIKLGNSPVENKYRGFGEVSPPITMEFESLGLQIRPFGGEVKSVLMGVSGSFSPRRLNAILGPSGCGKTTFLNVLCGKIHTGVIMGKVRINGEQMPVARLKKIMGFVPQDDIVHEDLSVRENLNYSARLRLPSDMHRSQRRDVVHDALEMLGLSAIQHYRVGTVEKRGISGGQRKRVNIGLELVAMPSLLFLDEPTSGLDATSSADILSSLADMANLGMNIIMVIHQPRFSSFLMFDQVLLLGGGGLTVYLGSPSAAMLYFTKYLGYRFPDRENPSDILMDIIAGKVPCAGDSRLKTCSQLVDKWTNGGMAWVETLETLNPTMVTKMSEVDPTIMLAIDEEFDLLDEEGTGKINSVQLVKLFGALGQDITLEDAVILIRKINSNRPASAKSGTKSGAASGSIGASSLDGVDGLTVTKRQLLDAFQGVREGNDDNPEDGTPQRNAAAKFYASHFLLPDLPEVKSFREEIERQRQARRTEFSGGIDPYSASGYDTASRATALETNSVGYSSNPGGEHIDSDSYSNFGHVSYNNGLSGGDAGGDVGADAVASSLAVVESILRRSVLSPGRPSADVQLDSGVTRGARVVNGVAATNRTIRAAALLPGLTQNSSSVSSIPASASAAGGVTATDSDGSRAGDLSAFAQSRQRQLKRATSGEGSGGGGASRWRRPQVPTTPEIEPDLSAAEPEPFIPIAVKEESSSSEALAEVAKERGEEGGLSGAEDDAQLSVSPGLVATSLAAMQALGRADVPLPELPRRAPDMRSLRHDTGRLTSNAGAFETIRAYVETYNNLVEAEATATATVAAAAAQAETMRYAMNAAAVAVNGELLTRGSGPTTVGGTIACVNARRASGGTKVHPRRRSSSQAGLGGVQLQIPGRSESASRPLLGPAQLRIQEEDSGCEDAQSSPTSLAALPPLLRQLASLPGPVAEAHEGGGADITGSIVSAPAGVIAADVASLAVSISSPRPAVDGTSAPASSPSIDNRYESPAEQQPSATALTPPQSQTPLLQAPPPSLSQSPNKPVEETPGRLPPQQPQSPQQLQMPQSQHQVQASLQGRLEQEVDNTGSPVNNSSMSIDSQPGYTQLPPVVLPGSHYLTGDLLVPPPRLAPVATGLAPGNPSSSSLHWGVLKFTDRTSKLRRTRTTRFAVTRKPTDAASLGMADLPRPEEAFMSGQSSPGTPSGHVAAPARMFPGGAGDTPCTEAGASTPASGAGLEDGAGGGGSAVHSSNVHRLARLRQEEQSILNSAPLPFMGVDTSVSSHGGSNRPRRASLGVLTGTGRKQRRRSWLQTQGGSDGSQEGSAPGGARKPRKDTLYVNSLLSNALVGAWAATQSVTAGRMNQSMQRMLRPQFPIEGPGSQSGAGGGNSSSNPNTPKQGLAVGLRGMAINRSMASTNAVATASRVPSVSAGVAINNILVNRLDMEEALASRKSQGFFSQLAFLLRRGCIKYVRSFWPMRVLDTLLQLAAAFIIGLVHGTKWGITSVPSNTVMCMVCLGVLSCVTHLRTFSNNRVLLWREAASGMSVLAYYLSQNIIDQLWVFIAPALSLGVYYYLTLPRMPFSEFYVVGLFVCWWASGMAYLVSAVLPPQNVLMAGVFISLIFGAFLNGLTYQIADARGTFMEGVMGLSYNRWAMEIVSISELKWYQNDMRNTLILMARSIGLCGVDKKLKDDGQDGISPEEAISFLSLQYDFSVDYCDRYKSIGYVALFSLGLGFRLLAFIFLRQNCVKQH